jgi:hypothetical protein
MGHYSALYRSGWRVPERYAKSEWSHHSTPKVVLVGVPAAAALSLWSASGHTEGARRVLRRRARMGDGALPAGSGDNCSLTLT